MSDSHPTAPTAPTARASTPAPTPASTPAGAVVTTTIPLGSRDRLTQLFTYPNRENDPDTLEQTIAYWVGLTLEHDGIAAPGARCSVAADDADDLVLTLTGPAGLAETLATYAARIPKFLDLGWTALTVDIKALRDGTDPNGRTWNPQPDRDGWTFFMCHGLPMANQRVLQFFHYPPIRLLHLRNYLADPVPWRVEELLAANGVSNHAEAMLYERVMDATPIGASDGQGSLGVIPIESFPDYQRGMTELLLNDAPGHDGYTIPIVVYGQHPNETFDRLYLGGNVISGSQKHIPAQYCEVIPGKKTPVVGCGHPYAFYAIAQDTIGSGVMKPGAGVRAAATMRKDLAVARWQVMMSEDPTRSPADTYDECVAFWKAPEQAHEVCRLVRHQASLFYPLPNDPDLAKQFSFQFMIRLDDAGTLCGRDGDAT